MKHQAAAKVNQAVLARPGRGSARGSDRGAAAHPVLGLHDVLGNRGTLRYLQTKLRVSRPGDPSEEEADRVAAEVSSAGPLPDIARKCACSGPEPCPACQGNQEMPAPRRALSSPTAGPLSATTLPRLGPGRPLDDGPRSFMESRFGRDFREVRIHTDSVAAEATRALQALAFTVATDVVFGAGAYAPDSGSGRQLLAHELTHVVQQGQAAPVAGCPHQGLREAPAPRRDVPRDHARARLAPRAGAAGVVQRQAAPAVSAGKAAPPVAGPAQAGGALAPGAETIEFEGRPLSTDGPSTRAQLWTIFHESSLQGLESFLQRFAASIQADKQEVARKQDEITAAQRFAAEAAEYPSDVSGVPWSLEMYNEADRQIAVVQQRIALKEKISPILTTEATAVRERPTLATEDLALLARLEGRHPLYRTLRNYRAAVQNLRLAEALRGTAKDPAAAAEALDFHEKRVGDLQEQLQRELREQGFGSLEEFEQATSAFQGFFQRYALQTGFAMLRENEELVRAEARRYGGGGGPGGGVSELKQQLGPLRAKVEEAEKSSQQIAEAIAMSGGEPINTEDPRLEAEARAIARGMAARFPILADPKLDLHQLVRADDRQLQALLGGTAADRLNDIEATRRNLTDDPELVWQMEGAVARAKQDLGIRAGSVYDLIIQDKLAAIRRNELFRNLLLGALAIGLGLLSGGTGTVAVLAAVGGAVVSTGLAVGHIREYLVKQAAVGSAFDRAKALSANEPSLFWLALDIAGAVIDLGAAASAFSKLAPAARSALAAEREAAAGAEAAEGALRSAARDAGLSEEQANKLVEDVRRAAREEKELLQAPAKAADLAPFRTALGAEVRVTPNGWIFVCYSPCQQLRDAFEALRLELVERIGEKGMWAFERQVSALEAFADRAARTGQITPEFRRQVQEAAGALHDQLFEAVRLPHGPEVGKAARLGDEVFGADLARFSPDDPLIGQLLAQRGTWLHEEAYRFLRRSGNFPENTLFTENTVNKLAAALGRPLPFRPSTGPDLFVLNYQTHTIFVVDMTRVAGRPAHLAKGAADIAALQKALRNTPWTVSGQLIEPAWAGLTTGEEFGRVVASLLRPFAAAP
jgi:hypothetical protein